MKKYPLLKTLFAKKENDFTEGLTELLLSREFTAFTLWQISGGSICKPEGGNNGVTEGTFDIFDLGYDGNKTFRRNLTLAFFDKTYPIYAGFFCHIWDNTFTHAITFHEPISADAYGWLQALYPFLVMRIEDLKGNEHRMAIFVDYQRKIDFVKDSGQILKALTLNDVMVNALNFFADTFHSEVSCVMLDNLFIGFGLEKDDLAFGIFAGEMSMSDYLTTHNDTIFMDQDLQSPKFHVDNVFIVREPTFGATFLLFNITVDTLPDKEFSALISHIVAIAIENAKYHERATKLKVEEAEMSQTVEILNQFVAREIVGGRTHDIYGVNHPARSTGGDFAIVTESDDYIFFCVADVCGKGYSAAVFTVMLSTVMDPSLCPDTTDIAGITNGINRYIINHKFGDRFITAFFCHYDKKSKVLKYISCGHEPTMLLTDTGIKKLTSQNLPLGLLDEDYIAHEENINAGDSIFAYTDGIIEYINHEALQSLLIQWRDKNSKELVSELYASLVPAPEEQKDDFTCVAVKFGR